MFTKDELERRRKKLKGAAQLKALDVDRIDGVDKPATGRRFILFKSAQEQATALQKAEAIGNATREYDIDSDELFRPQEVEDSTHADTESARLAQRLESFAGQVEDVTTRPAWATDPFLHGDADPDGGAPRPLGYAVVEDPGIAAPSATFPKVGSGMNDVVAAPANFDAPKPQPRRLGSGYVMKRVSFANVIYGTSNEQATEAIEKSSRQPEPSLADVFGLAK